MVKPITVVIAEDHKFVRKGIHALLDLTRDIQVIGEACNGREAVALIEEKKPDVLVLDICMPIMDGIQVIEQLHKDGKHVHILVFSGEIDHVYRQSLLELGVDGVLPKGGKPETLIDAVRTVAGKSAELFPLLQY